MDKVVPVPEGTYLLPHIALSDMSNISGEGKLAEHRADLYVFVYSIQGVFCAGLKSWPEMQLSYKKSPHYFLHLSELQMLRSHA